MKKKKKNTQSSHIVDAILILVVLIALAAIFKTQLTNLVSIIFEKIVSMGTAI